MRFSVNATVVQPVIGTRKRHTDCFFAKPRTQRANAALVHARSVAPCVTSEASMRYEIVEQAGAVEAIGAHSGYRIRMALGLSATGPQVRVWVRGSESEEEVEVGVPLKKTSNREEAFDHGYAQAALWIDAENKRIL
jgi:hypothetical protein